MQKLRRSFILLTLLLGFVHTACPQSQSSRPRSKRVIDQMIQALGGQAFLDVRDIHTSGRFFSFSRGQLSGLDTFSDYIKFPDMERTEFGHDKNRSVTINQGNRGWKIEGKNDPEIQSAAEADEFLAGFKTSFDYVLRFVVNAPKTTIQILPAEMIGFKRVDVIELRDPMKNLIRFYVDRRSRLPVKMDVRRMGQSEVNEELYANWHEFQGVNTPLFVSRSRDGVKKMEIRAETAEYNSGLPDSLFAPPVK